MMPTQNRLASTLTVVLLALILALTAYSTVSEELHRQARREAVESMVESQRRVANSLLSDYETLAYDNDQVERIAEQQLIAAEHQLRALQLIALQNTQIMELLADE